MERTLTDIQNEMHYLGDPDFYEKHWDDCHYEGGSTWYRCKECDIVFQDYNHGLHVRSKKPSNYCEECETAFHERLYDDECTCEQLTERYAP